jgi:hypothetical protein
MTLKDKATIQRMLGKIEGMAFVVGDKIAVPLLDAIEVIDCVLDREDGADNDD